MRYLKARRLIAWLLCLILCLSIPCAALAEEDGLISEAPSPEGETISSLPEDIIPEEEAISDFPEDLPEDLPEEIETAGEEELLANEAVSLADEPLLKLGGHETYLGGYPGAIFKPESYMTRAEVAQMLYNLLNQKPESTSSKFSDVPDGRWYSEASNALASLDVIRGYSDGTFLPNKTITRAEFVTIICRCFSLEKGGSIPFEDSVSHWALESISAAYNAGWIDGETKTQFMPNRGIKRCEAVKVMNSALNRRDERFAADRAKPKFYDVTNVNYWAYLEIAEAAKPDVTIPDPQPQPDDKIAVGKSLRVLASALNMRSGPDTSSSVVTVLPQNTIITVTDVSSLPWIGVKTSSGQTGFVNAGPDDDPYVEVYVPGQITGAALSASTLSFHQYQTVRLDGSISSGKLSDMKWSSSDPSVAVVGYVVDYGSSKTEGAMVYGKKAGSAVITFSDATGNAAAKCTVTVTAPEPVRYAYSSENAPEKGQSLALVAITDTSRSSVTFSVTGPSSAAWTTRSYTTEKRDSRYGLPTNTVRVFKYPVSFTAAGIYTVKVSADGSGAYEFTVLVADDAGSATATAFSDRKCSTECLKIIANFEGSVPEIEDDQIANGNPTVGYGNVIQKNQAFYNNLTTSEIYAMLVDKINDGGYAKAVNTFRSTNNLKISQAQFDALVSFVYNCGSGPLGKDKGVAMSILNAVTPPTGLSENSPRSGTLNVSDSAIYREAGLTAEKIGSAPQGAAVQVIDAYINSARKEVWYRVKYQSVTGWVPAGKIKLSGSVTHDLAYADSATVANNWLQWNKSAGKVWAGLVWRRMAELKIFFHGNYAEAYHTSANYQKNTYGFDFPSDCKEFDHR